MEQPPAYPVSPSSESTMDSYTKSAPPNYVSSPFATSSAAPEQTSFDPSSTPQPFPKPTDSPEIVRSYLEDFLQRYATTHSLTQGEISKFTAAWRHGTGQELRDYDLATWKELMGTEMGFIIHKATRKARQTEPMPTFVKVIVCMPTLVFFGIIALAFSTASDGVDGFTGARVWAWSGFALMFAIMCMACFGRKFKEAYKKSKAERMARRQGVEDSQVPLMVGRDGEESV